MARHVQSGLFPHPERGTRLAVTARSDMSGFLTRRQIREVFVLAPSWIGLFPRVSGRTFRFAVHSSVDADARRGIELALSDAREKARLLGASVEINIGGAEGAGLAGVVIGSDASAPRANVPVICVSAEPHRGGSNVFSIAPTQDVRRAMVAAWRARQPHPSKDAGHLDLVEWHDSLTAYGAGELNERFHRSHNLPMTPAAWRGYFAVKALTETALRRATASDRCRAVLEAEFDGHKGTRLTFDRATRSLRQPLYLVRRGTTSGIVDEVR